MQNVNPHCAAALAALLLSAGPVAAQTDVTEQAAQAVEEVVDVAAELLDASEPEGVSAEAVGDGFASDVERYSYGIGVDIGRSFKTQGIEISVETMREALGAAYAGDALRQTEEQSLAAMRSFQEMMGSRQAAQTDEQIGARRAEATAFLAKNGAREGVVTTESGLQYEILEAGEGALAGPDDTVTLHYTGTLLDGTTFDSSEGRGPASFPVTGVIAGFAEGLQLLPMGTKAKLFMPADLAYADSPQGPGGPGSALIFEVQMLGIEAAPEKPSLAEMIEQAQQEMEESLTRIREDGEQRIAALEAEMELQAGDASSATVGGAEPEAVEQKKEPMYD